MTIKPNTHDTQTPLSAQAHPQSAAATPLAPLDKDKSQRQIQTAAKPEAARGDDALMSQPAKVAAASDHGSVRAEMRSSRWKSAVAQANVKWSKIGIDELTRCDGQEQPLAKLLEQHYQLSASDSHRQARHFLAAHA